jgi:hypothetical protein
VENPIIREDIRTFCKALRSFGEKHGLTPNRIIELLGLGTFVNSDGNDSPVTLRDLEEGELVLSVGMVAKCREDLKRIEKAIGFEKRLGATLHK